jgi:hypothetical protein
VRYDEQTKTVTAIRGQTNITLPVGGRRALVGDRAVTLDAPAQISNGSVLVPLRFVAEALGAQVTFDVGTRTIAIALAGDAPTPAPRDASDAASVDVTVAGTVVAVYPDLAPRRIVVRVPDPDGGTAGATLERTIPLRPDAVVSVRRPNSLLAISLDRVRVGDRVEVRQTPEGVATALEVTARAPQQQQTANSTGGAGGSVAPGGDPVVAPRPPASRNSGGGARAHVSPGTPAPPAAAATFKGEFLEANRISASRYVLKMTDGRLVEVPGDVLVFYGNEKVTINDLRSGDALTVSVDPKTKRGTRVVVAVEK